MYSLPKHFNSCLTGIIFCGAVNAFGQNPLICDQFTADPTARVFDGKVYIYPSHDIDPSNNPHPSQPNWFCMADYHVFSSDNLTTWHDHGVILDQKDIPWGQHDAYSMWAPDCIQGNDGRYYFYFPNAPKDGRGFGVGVAISDTPYGPFTPQQKNIEGVSGIDPCVLQASDGNAYIFWGGGGLRVAKLKSNLLELAEDNPVETVKFGDHEFTMVGKSVDKTLPEGFKEGPFAFERNGKYYLTYPWVRGKKGDIGPDGQEIDNPTETLAYAMSDSPMGPYEYKGIIMAESPTHCWTNHHSLVEYNGQWFLFYHHNDYSPSFDKNRSICADSLRFNPDGTIQQVFPTRRGIGVTNARSPIHIDRYSTANGVTSDYINPRNPFEGWFINYTDKASSTYNKVDFSDKEVTTISIRAKAPKGGKLVLTDLTTPLPTWNGHKLPKQFAEGWSTIATVEIPTTTDYTVITLPINRSPKGIVDLQFSSLDGREISIDWLGFDLQPELHAALLSNTALNPATKGAFDTHHYRNVFAELGYTQKQIDNKLQELYDALFTGPDRIYFEVGDDMAYISDVKNHDARTEGMSYGLMIAVQLDKKEVFDKLWRWAKANMQIKDGKMKGYFKWSVAPDGSRGAMGAASDGELYFITSLIFASNRWGNNSGIDYLHEAQYILDCVMGHDGQPRLIDPNTNLITFIPGANFTDPSYHIPAFYEVWAKWANDGRSDYWNTCAQASRLYLHKVINPLTGLNPDYSNYDGSLLNNGRVLGDAFRYDSWRVAMNVAMDYSWACKDIEWQQHYGHTLQNFLYSQGIDSFLDQYNIDGSMVSEIMEAGGYKELRHTPGFIATSAALSLVCSHSKSREFIDRFWNSKHVPFPSGYFDAYYEGILRLFAFMHLSGNYQIIEPK